jgi:hypothetical protein
MLITDSQQSRHKGNDPIMSCRRRDLGRRRRDRWGRGGQRRGPRIFRRPLVGRHLFVGHRRRRITWSRQAGWSRLDIHANPLTFRRSCGHFRHRRQRPIWFRLERIAINAQLRYGFQRTLGRMTAGILAGRHVPLIALKDHPARSHNRGHERNDNDAIAPLPTGIDKRRSAGSTPRRFAAHCFVGGTTGAARRSRCRRCLARLAWRVRRGTPRFAARTPIPLALLGLRQSGHRRIGLGRRMQIGKAQQNGHFGRLDARPFARGRSAATRCDGGRSLSRIVGRIHKPFHVKQAFGKMATPRSLRGPVCLSVRITRILSFRRTLTDRKNGK